MNIETNRCVCDECNRLKPNSIIITTSDERCSFQFCEDCARRVLNILKIELKEE